MSPLVAGLLGGLAGNYFSGDKEKNLLDLLGKKANANPQTDPNLPPTDPDVRIQGVKQGFAPRPPQPQPQPQQGGGFMSGLKDAWNDEEKRARMTIAFNSLRHKPDANIATSMENKIKALQGKKKSNSTADYLAKTNPKIAEMLRQGIIDPKTAISMLSKDKPSALMEKMKLWAQDPEKFALMKEAGVIGGGGVNINMGDKENFEFIKAGITDAKAQIKGGYSADNSLRDIATLRELGENPILQEVPDMARGFIPTGYSPAMDAYNGQLNKVAKGLRQAGEGVMTEKDFEVLQETSGAASMNIKARRILQTSLEETARRQIQRSKIAQQYMSQRISLSDYYDQVNALMNQPMFSKEQRGFINSLKGTSGYSGLTEAERNSVPKGTWNRMTSVQREAFFNARGK